MTRTRRALSAPGPRKLWAAPTSSRKSPNRRVFQSAAGSAMALTCLYADTGKNAGAAVSGWPVTTAVHRSVISAWKTGVAALGSAWVWGRPGGGGGTAITLGEALGEAGDWLGEASGRAVAAPRLHLCCLGDKEVWAPGAPGQG